MVSLITFISAHGQDLIIFANDELVKDCGGVALVSTPLHKAKAEFFKTLGHPIRIRVLELLVHREHAVSELLTETGVEPANLSQQLGVLRRAGLVTVRREGSTAYYSLHNPRVPELLSVARELLGEVLSGQAELLADLKAEAEQ